MKLHPRFKIGGKTRIIAVQFFRIKYIDGLHKCVKQKKTGNADLFFAPPLGLEPRTL